MTVNINAANITSIRLAEQSSNPGTPASGFASLFVDSNGDLATRKDAGGIKIATSPASGDYTLTVDGTGTAARLNASQTFSGNNTLSGDNTLSGTNTHSGSSIFTGAVTITRNGITHRDTTLSSSNRTSVIHFVKFIPTVSLGTMLTIPIISQGSYTERTLLIIRGVSGEVNTTSPRAFGVDVMFNSLTTLGSPTAYNGFGNYSSVTTSGMDLRINFTAGYTASTLSDGIALYIQKIGMANSEVVDFNNIVLN